MRPRKQARRTGGSNLSGLLEHNDTLMQWLARDEKNLQKFHDDPRAAFAEATGVKDVESLISSCRKELAENRAILPSRRPVASPAAQPAIAPSAVRLATAAVFADYTQGWDLVSAVTQKVVNDALRHFSRTGPSSSAPN